MTRSLGVHGLTAPVTKFLLFQPTLSMQVIPNSPMPKYSPMIAQIDQWSPVGVIKNPFLGLSLSIKRLSPLSKHTYMYIINSLSDVSKVLVTMSNQLLI